LKDNTLSSLMLANITGNVFMLCRDMGKCDADNIRQYEQRIIIALQKKAGQGASEAELHKQLMIELDRIRHGFNNFKMPEAEQPIVQSTEHASVQNDQLIAHLTASNPVEASDIPDDEAVETGEDSDAAQAAEDSPVNRKDSGYKPKHTEMQEKLQIERKPLADLLKKDCVDHGLLSSKRAKHWVHNMSGRIKEEVEADVVIEISQNLHKKVKNYISKNKGDNPWSTPILQNDLRNDITSVKTVRGVLLLSAQINAEVDRHEAGKKPGIFKRLFKGGSKLK